MWNRIKERFNEARAGFDPGPCCPMCNRGTTDGELCEGCQPLAGMRELRLSRLLTRMAGK